MSLSGYFDVVQANNNAIVYSDTSISKKLKLKKLREVSKKLKLKYKKQIILQRENTINMLVNIHGSIESSTSSQCIKSLGGYFASSEGLEHVQHGYYDGHEGNVSSQYFSGANAILMEEAYNTPDSTLSCETDGNKCNELTHEESMKEGDILHVDKTNEAKADGEEIFDECRSAIPDDLTTASEKSDSLPISHMSRPHHWRQDKVSQCCQTNETSYKCRMTYKPKTMELKHCFKETSMDKTVPKIMKSGNRFYCSKCFKYVSSKSTGYRHFKNCSQNELSFDQISLRSGFVDRYNGMITKDLPSSHHDFKCTSSANCHVKDDCPPQKEIISVKDAELVEEEETVIYDRNQTKSFPLIKAAKKTNSPYFHGKSVLSGIHKWTLKGSRGAHQYIKYRPPKSPFNLIQEKLYSKPWQLLIATIFLNVTTNRVALPIFDQFIEKYNRPEQVINADWREIAELMKPMGIYEKRAKYIIRFSEEYLNKDWFNANELFGIGKYGDDSYRIFCLGQWKHVKPEDHKLNLYHEWIIEQDRLGFLK